MFIIDCVVNGQTQRIVTVFALAPHNTLSRNVEIQFYHNDGWVNLSIAVPAMQPSGKGCDYACDVA